MRTRITLCSFRGQTVPFETSDPGGSTVYHDLKFSDAYDNRYTTGAEFDYAVNPNITAYGRFAYQMFHGQNIQGGVPPPLGPPGEARRRHPFLAD